MPTYVVTDPNTGKKVRLTGDTPPTDADLDEIFSSIQTAAPAASTMQAPQQQPSQDVGIGEALGSGFVRGVEQVTGGTLQRVAEFRKNQLNSAIDEMAAKLESGELPATPENLAALDRLQTEAVKVSQGLKGAEGVETGKRAEYAPVQEQRPIASTIGNIGGQIAGLPIPGMQGRIPAQMIKGGLEGALSGYVQPTVGDESEAQAAMLGGGIGALAPAALRPITNAASDAFGLISRRAPQEAVPAPMAAPARQEVNSDVMAQEATQSAGDTAQNASRRAAFEDLGLTPTEAQRTRDTDLFTQQQDMYRKGGDVRTALERQEEILDRRTRGEVAAMGGRPEEASIAPIKAINDKALQLDAQIGDLYKQARSIAPNEKNIRFSRAAQTLREKSPIDARTDGTVSALRDEMKRLGFLDPKGQPTRLTSVQASENLRQFANTLYDGANPLARGVIRDFKNSLDDDVFSVAGDDIFKQAREAKSSFEKGLSTDARNKFDTRRVSLVRDILDNTVTEDKLVQQVLGRSSKYGAKDVAELKRYLLSGTPGQIAQGEQAWNDIRASAMEKIRDKAFKGAETQTGTRSLSRAGLESALKEIGPQKFNVLFNETERDFIQKLSRVAALKEPPPGTFTGSGPSSPAIRKLEEAVSKIPVFGGFTKDISDAIRTRATEKRVLTLIDDAEKLAKESRKNSEKLIPLTGSATRAPFAIESQEDQQ